MEQQKNYYAIIPANVRYDEDLIPSAKLLYGEITALCNDKGFCWATNNYFASLYKVNERTIRTWLDSLINKGYIVRKMIPKNNGEFQRIISINVNSEINFHDGRNIPEGRNKSSEGEEENFQRVGIKVPEGTEEKFLYNNTINITDNITFNNTNNKEQKNDSNESVEEIKKIKDSLKKPKNNIDNEIKEKIQEWTNNDELRNTLFNYIQHRKDLKKPVKTINTLNLIFNQLEKNKSNAIEMLNQSILNGWIGLFDVRSTVKAGTGNNGTSNNIFDEIGRERGYW